MAKKKTQKKTTSKNSRATPRQSKSVAEVSTVKRAAGASWSFSKLIFWRLVLASVVCLVAYTAYLDVTIRREFEGQKWAIPAHLYTRPLELYLGQNFDAELVESELKELGYVASSSINRVGTYNLSSQTLKVHQRAFRFWDEDRPRQRISLSVVDGRIADIKVIEPSGNYESTEIVRLEPRLFGSVSPLNHEDRTLVKLEEVPQALIDALIAYEDRQFYSHFGLNFKGLARVAFHAIKTGKVIGGGSSLTQQLVKNYFLTSERSLRRKVPEMIMSVLLEIHYDKNEILQAYINEVNLGQAGNRAIHGFGLASRYYYGRPLNELDLGELTTLVAINNAPSRYNPLRRPERVVKKRDVVLKAMLEADKIDNKQYELAKASELRISPVASRAATLSYPSFLGLVRNDLKDAYKSEDLHSEGLQIYTTINPRIQAVLETSVSHELDRIEKDRKLAGGTLQAAAVVLRTDNGEVAAMLGDRNASFAGFNRALKAKRPVGSLLKPFVFLTALESPNEYSLASLLPDTPVIVQQKGSPDWQPSNYDGRSHGDVMMVEALSQSYNLATVNLGLELGLSNVIDTLERVGHDRHVRELPSVLLGAVPMSVLDVSRMYLTLASGGFKMPVKSVRSVLSGDGAPLNRYALDMEQVVDPEYTHLINYALQDTVRNGTGRVILRGFDYDYGIAGKTGTTNDYRDSWFAGFSGNYLTVVWVGRDDNKPTGLTGASGAARVWKEVMQRLPLQRLELGFSEEIVSQQFFYSKLDAIEQCSESRTLPLLLSSLELENMPCPNRIEYDDVDLDESKYFEPTDEEMPIERRQKKKSLWQRIFG